MPEGGALPVVQDGSDYRFLVGRLIDDETLRLAAAEAGRVGVGTHEVLIARGWVTSTAYAAALSVEIGIEDGPAAGRTIAAVTQLIDVSSMSPSAVVDEVGNARAQRRVPLLVGRDAFDWAEQPVDQQARVRDAADGLKSRQPALSAASPIAAWQLIAVPAVVGIAAGGLIVAPEDTLIALAALMMVPFLFVVGLRIISLALILRRHGEPRRRSGRNDVGRGRIADAELPVYSIMVPLFREADVLPQIVAAIGALDYPAVKLDVLLVLESVDQETLAAARALDLPASIRVIVVPDEPPRTKPKALNYAFGFARGDYVVVYDAEDEPEPGQLRLALAAFRTGPADLACVQARLNIYNSEASWLTRQFTIEYSTLFDAMLPALVRLGLPVPLGGTSNHFPAETLRGIGGWDPHNVTEDADLGLRIARIGGRVMVLDSTTWEEAPPTFGIWVRQRTRWLKGFMQTWLVHMRSPRRLLAELGLVGFIGFQAFIGGIILSALIYPIFLLLLLDDIASGEVLSVPDSWPGQLVLGLQVFNLVGGTLTGMGIAGVVVARRGFRGMLGSIALMPVYWLLISMAAYRAVWQLIRNPYLWEKTPHRPRRSGRRRRG